MGRERVLHRPNQSEHLKCIVFVSVHLEPQGSVIMYKPGASSLPHFTSDQAAKMLQESAKCGMLWFPFSSI